MAKEIRMIMSDLDGTLFDDNNVMTETDYNALNRAVDAGIKFVPVTARFPALAEPLISRLPMAEYVVYGNGTSIYNRKTGECIYRDEMKKETALKLFEYLDNITCIPAVALNGVSYIDKGILERSLPYVELARGYDTLIDKLSVIADVKEMLRTGDYNVEIMYILYPDLETKAEAEKEILKIDDLSTLGSLPREHVISNASATKENIVLKTNEIFGIDPSEVMAFGDGDNDSGMLKNAGAGVAMANAMPLAKASARFSTLAVWEGGEGHMINRYLDGDLEGFEYRGNKL